MQSLLKFPQAPASQTMWLPANRDIQLRLSWERPEAIDFLLSLVQDGEKPDKDAAIKALELHRDSRDIAERVKEAIQKRLDDGRA